MKKFTLSFLVIPFLLTSCVNTELSTAGKQYNPETDARIRLFGQNGRPTVLTVDIDGKKEKITVGGGAGQAFSSMLGVKGNESIGMPETELSKNPSILNGVLSSSFFKEFVIPAGKEVTINNSITPVTHSFKSYTPTLITTTTTTFKGCSGNEIKFIPEAGKDYESAPLNLTKGCGVDVYEIK